MTKINEVIEFVRNISLEAIIDIWIAIGIVIAFRILKGSFAYIIIKMFKYKEKNSKKIKNNPFYDPLKSFFGFLGIYLAVLFLSEPFNISQDTMNIVTKIFKIVIIITTAVGLANSITTKSTFIEKLKEKSDKELDRNTIRFIIKIIRIAIYIIAGFMVITELGYNLNGLIAGLGIGSVVITLAAQDTAKNIFGGLTIFLDKPFKIGDYIKIDSFEGTVEDISFRSTRVRTLDGSLLYVPNSEVAAQPLINCSQKIKTRYRKNIFLDAKAQLEKIEICKGNIIKMLELNEIVVKESINVKFLEISPMGVNLLIDCFINTTNEKEFLAIKEDINYKVMQIFNNENIKLANNFQTFNVRS